MSAIIIAVILVIISIIICIITSYTSFKYAGWNDFNIKYNENFQVIIEPEKVSNLLFKNCVYKIIGKDNQSKTKDVTSNLNRMAAAYEGNTNAKAKFKLSDPGLNEYSFIIEGINDPNTIGGSGQVDDNWTSQNVSLSGSYKLLN